VILTLVDGRRIGKRILIHMSVDSKPHRGNGNPVTYGAGATNARSTAGCSKGPPKCSDLAFGSPGFSVGSRVV